MLETLDKWLETRLGKITHNDVPVKVYKYWPNREKGEERFPCFAFERMYVRPDLTRARPAIEIAIPSEEETTIQVPIQMTRSISTPKTGPVRYTIRQFPTPITVFYHVHALATRKHHADQLQLGLLQAFPPGYSPTISGQHPLVCIGDVENMDDLDVPLFAAITSLSVGVIWIDRLESYEVPSIQEVDFVIEPEDDEGI